MKTDIKSTLNKLIAYARNNLMLDALDEVYVMNRLAALCGVTPPELTDDDVDDITPHALLDELKATVPGVDCSAVLDAIMPAPHTIDYYFTDALSRNSEKAFEFLYELYEFGGCVDPEPERGDGVYRVYTHKEMPVVRPIMLNINGPLPYTPLVSGNRIAAAVCEDVFSSDIAARLSAYVQAYGGAIAKRIGTDSDYMCCSAVALSSAKVKKQISDGPAKLALLDYPVPAVSVSGIAKNAVSREAAKLIKLAADAGLPCVAACAADKSGAPVYYLVFAKDASLPGTLALSDALTACGVFCTVDFAPLLPVLEKGVALSSDLAQYKHIYSAIGGVKHGAKAGAALDGEIIKQCLGALAAAASSDEAAVVALCTGTGE